MTVPRSPLRRTLGVLKPHVRRHAGLCALGLVAMLFDVIFRVLEPWPLKIAIDAVTAALGADLARTRESGRGHGSRRCSYWAARRTGAFSAP